MTQTEGRQAEQAQTGHPRRWVILGVLVISLLVVVIDNTIMNVALRVLADPQQGLGAGQAELEWTVNSYTLVFAGLLFAFGVLGDRYGRRRYLLIGMVLFGVSSLASAYAQNAGQLIAARALMGLGAAAILPATLAIISNVFDPRERARAIGVWASAVGLGAAIGPLVGGFLLERFWWGSIFFVNVPVVAAGILAIALLVPESRDPAPRRLDVTGVTLSVLGLVLLVYGIIDGGEHGFARPVVWAAIGGSALVLALFVWWERRATDPSLDVRLFRDPRFSTAVGVIALVFFAAFGVLFFMTFLLQLVWGLSPLQTGLVMLPFAVAQFAFAPRSAALVKRFGAKAVCAAGLALTVVSMGSLTLMRVDTPIWVVCVLFFIHGVGMANVMPPAMESVMSSLPREQAGVGSAVTNTARQVGGALGVAVLGAVVMAVYRREVADAVAGLPEPARAAAGESIAGAYATAERLGDPSLLPAADGAFLTAVHVAGVCSALIALAAAFVVLRWLPGRSRGRGADPAPAEPVLAEAP